MGTHNRRVAIITGGSSRIGRSIVKMLHTHPDGHCDVMIHYHKSREAAEELAKELNNKRKGSASIFYGPFAMLPQYVCESSCESRGNGDGDGRAVSFVSTGLNSNNNGEKWSEKAVLIHSLDKVCKDLIQATLDTFGGDIDILVNNASAYFPTPMILNDNYNYNAKDAKVMPNPEFVKKRHLFRFDGATPAHNTEYTVCNERYLDADEKKNNNNNNNTGGRGDSLMNPEVTEELPLSPVEYEVDSLISSNTIAPWYLTKYFAQAVQERYELELLQQQLHHQQDLLYKVTEDCKLKEERRKTVSITDSDVPCGTDDANEQQRKQLPLELIPIKPRHIINISDSLIGRSHGAHTMYSMAKGALDTLTVTSSVELAPINIRVNSVRPGYNIFPNNMSEESKDIHRSVIPLYGRREGMPEDVASAVQFLTTTGNNNSNNNNNSGGDYYYCGGRYCCGTFIDVDGGLRGQLIRQ